MKKQNSNNDILLIENYLDGKLNKQKEVQFQKRLDNEPDFAKLYRFRLKIRDDLQKADQYKNVHQQVAFAVKNVKKEKRRKIVYAVAASLALLIIISGVLTIVNQQHESSPIVSDESDTSKEETYQPQIKEPESYANTGHYNSEKRTKEISLSFTIDNDSLIFMWQPISYGESDIVVLSQESENELFRKQIKLATSRIALPLNELPAGKMIWFIDDFSARDSFHLAEIH